MGIVWLLILFLIWCICTIKTESKNVDRYHRMGDKYNEEKSAGLVVAAAFYLVMFALLALAALIL